MRENVRDELLVEICRVLAWNHNSPGFGPAPNLEKMIQKADELKAIIDDDKKEEE
ncbi:unnamed protein product [marine sediment metagenome]|uniref:Uncharacterized protein n=1 Tax=marine sediment metagenome TaxID=412755 RepID=X1NF25_9ZZZZ